MSDDFEQRLQEFRPTLDRSARKLCRNRHDAEDLVQATFVRALQARGQFVPGGNLGGWLYRILCNQHRDIVRRARAPHVSLDWDIPAPTADDDELSALHALPTEDVVAALGKLPDELRVPLEQHAIGGKRYREIADELKLPTNTVGTRIGRARQKLRAAFSLTKPGKEPTR